MNLFENGLKTLTPDERKAIAVGIRTTEYGWPLGMPTCDSLGHGLWEVRVSLKDKIARVFFCMEGSRMILLHGIENEISNEDLSN